MRLLCIAHQSSETSLDKVLVERQRILDSVLAHHDDREARDTLSLNPALRSNCSCTRLSHVSGGKL